MWLLSSARNCCSTPELVVKRPVPLSHYHFSRWNRVSPHFFLSCNYYQRQFRVTREFQEESGRLCNVHMAEIDPARHGGVGLVSSIPYACVVPGRFFSIGKYTHEASTGVIDPQAYMRGRGKSIEYRRRLVERVRYVAADVRLAGEC